jgi:hypothetical protein
MRRTHHLLTEQLGPSCRRYAIFLDRCARSRMFKQAVEFLLLPFVAEYEARLRAKVD